MPETYVHVANFSSIKAYKRSLRATNLSGFYTGAFSYVFVYSFFFLLGILYFRPRVKHYYVSLTVLPHACLHVIVSL